MQIPAQAHIPAFELLAVTLAGGAAALLADDTRMRRAFAGALVLGLAVASTRLLGDGSPALAVSGGIALAGLGVVAVSARSDLRGLGVGLPRRVALLVALLAAIGLTGWLFRDGVAAGTGRLIGTAAALFVAGVVLVRLLSRLPPLRWGGRRTTSGSAASNRGAATWRGVHVVAALGLLAAPHLHLFLFLLTVSFVAGVEFIRRKEGATRWPLSAILALPVLLLGWYLLARVAGEQSLAMRALPDAPYSEAFQLGVALGLSLLAWSLLRLWPFQGPSRGPLAPLAGAALLARVIAPGLPDGLTHWQPLLYLLALLAALHALLSRRVEGAPALLAVLTLASGQRQQIEPTVVGVGVAFALLAAAPEVRELLTDGGRTLNASGKVLARVLAVVAAALLVPALAAALSAQVVYTVATTAVLALAIAASAAPPARGA
jgi:hypothetical protein